MNYDIDLDDDGDTTNDWQIFYKEDNPTSPNYGATYIIPDYYVPVSKMTTALSNASMSYTGLHAVYWNLSSIPTYRTIRDDVKSIFMYDYTQTSEYNVRCVSTLLDTTIWESDFVTAELQIKGGMAIGSPTINMWCASWNKVYPAEIITPSIGGIGYQVNGSNSLNLSSYTGYKTDAPNVYFPTKGTTSSSGYWIASPSNSHQRSACEIYLYSTTASCSGTYIFQEYHGVRPVVYLPPSVTLIQDATTDNLWNINYGE